MNFWDNGYPDGGNFWSDYNGSDIKSGVLQDVSGSDGIGDLPYRIFPKAKVSDNYPLMQHVGTGFSLPMIKPTAPGHLMSEHDLRPWS